MEKIKIKENKNKIFFDSNNAKIPLKYPHLQNKEFQKKISLKKEFQYKYDGSIKNIIEENDKQELCKQNDINFELSPHQEFVKRFMNINTPYNGLLLYHGLGSGKTCSAIGITEEFRKSNKYSEIKKKIIIVASPNVQENFKLQLFNKSKLKKISNIWNLGGCVGNSLLHELKDYDLENMKKEQIIQKMDKIIRSNYYFMGYEQFANKIDRIGFHHLNNEIKQRINKKKLQHYFKDAMIVIDEVHNIRLIGDKSTKKTASSILKLIQNVKKMKLLFLSGTPMYNDPKEILFLINLLNLNDDRNILLNKEVFDKSGHLIIKNGNEIGKKKLIDKSNGYISYVRGENPYSFPYKIYPSDYDSIHSLKKYTYPLKQFNNKSILEEEKIKYLDVYLNQLSSEQKEGYEFIIQKIFEKYNNNQINSFENLDSFSYNLLQEPLYALNICYKNKDTGEFFTGKNGLEEVMSFDKHKTNFQYNIEEEIFNYKNIDKYSIKIKNILEHIIKSEGIVLVYSQLLDGGLVPLALALEEYGFKRAKHNNLFSNKKKIKPFQIGSKQACYTMITGDIEYSPNNNQELEYLNHIKNMNGDLCKVVLISQAGSEGLDFKHLRQVHIMEPWYNLNRIEQIIGRAIRNCSHKELPLEKRNCQIYLHATYLDEEKEAIDLMLYRFAEKKSEKIGIVQKLLKSISIDCLLNHSQTNFSKEDQIIKIKLSTGLEIDYNIKDKSYSSLCDYQENCDYQCINNITNNNVINTTSYIYDYTINEKIIDKIKKLFMINHAYKRNEIFNILSVYNVSDEVIEQSLTFLTENKNEFIIDKYLRKGLVVNIKDIYLFQPIELESNILMNDRKKPIYHKIKEIKIEDLPVKDKKKTNTTLTSKTSKINKIISRFQEKYKQGFIKLEGKANIKACTDFYLLYDTTINILNQIIEDIKIDDTLQKKFLIQHMLEELPFNEEVLLVEYLFKNELNEMESIMKAYYETFIYTFNEELTLLFLVNLQSLSKNASKTKAPISSSINIMVFNRRVNQEQNVFRKINRLELAEIGLENIKSFLNIKNKNLFKIVGFFDYYETSNDILFKTKETNAKSKKNKGAFFINKIPKLMKDTLNTCLEKEIFKDKKGLFDLNKYQLVIIMEMMMRYYDLNKKNDFRYYLNKLEYVNI